MFELLSRPILSIRTLYALLTVVLLNGCDASKPKHPELLVNWMTNPRQICIGRFVLKTPSIFVSKWQKYIYNGDQLKITFNVPLAAFNRRVQTREQQLVDNKRRDITQGVVQQTKVSWLETAVSPQADSRLLIFQELSSQDGTGVFDTEGYAWRDNTMFLFESQADEDKVALAIADEKDKFLRVKAVSSDSVPTEPGFCFEGGLMAGKGVNEFATAYYEHPSTPGGAIFGIEMRPNVPSDDKLLDRVPKLLQMMGNLASHTRTLRQEDRALAGLDGQEILTKINADGVTAYYFIWEGKGESDSVIHPNTHIELRIGGEENKQTYKRETAALSEEEALALWDAILQSFERRPNAV
jgi:Tle cognate immunity protein 4 C-terminal domain/Tle cognate immunity protein 4 N-terminal domain